jgi:hypothetical protein
MVFSTQYLTGTTQKRRGEHKIKQVYYVPQYCHTIKGRVMYSEIKMNEQELTHLDENTMKEGKKAWQLEGGQYLIPG